MPGVSHDKNHMLKVLILDPIWERAPQLFAEHGVDTLPVDAELAAEHIDFVIVRSSSGLAAARLAGLRRKGLQAVLRAGSGLDNIDTHYCKEHGIGIVNFPGANAQSVGELTLAYMLGLVRRLYPAQQEMRNGYFGKNKYLGRSLQGCSVGFVGYGATARASIALLRTIGVENIRVHRQSSGADNPHQVQLVDLRTVFQADIVSLHVPLNGHTRFMVNDPVLSGAKPGLFLLNLARRDVVDHEALLAHLNSGHVAGYASDVLDAALDRELINHLSVFATPHLGAQSLECQRSLAFAILEYILGRQVAA